MNDQFRRRPIVVQAFQMTEARRQDNSEWPNWLNWAWNMPPGEVGAVYGADYPDSHGTDKLVIHTLEGPLNVEWNSYIVRGVEGELWAVKESVFQKTYEAVDTPADGS